MRRTHGTALTPHELRVLAAMLQLHADGRHDVKGADLWAWLRDREERGPSAATVYRALRRLTDDRGLFAAREEVDSYLGGKPRVYYTLTSAGLDAARAARVTLATRGDTEGIARLHPRAAE